MNYTIPRANAPIAGSFMPTTQWYNFINFLDKRTSSDTVDVQNEITEIAIKLGSPDGTVTNIPPLPTTTKVLGTDSVSSSGVSVVQLNLVNDVATASAVSFYGTDSDGEKGWNLLFDAFEDTENIFKINTDGIVSFDLTDISDSGVGLLLATTFDAKGRKTGSRAATITGTAGRVTVANGDASAGLPTIDLDTVSDAGGGSLLGFTRDAWGRVSGTHAITVTGTTNQIGVYDGTGSGAAITLTTPQDIATSSTPTFAQVALAADPTTALQAATKQYVDSVAAGLNPKAPALLATTANDTLAGLAARDGITPAAGDRVLVKNQTLPAQNGIYIASAAAWTRAPDMAAWAQVPSAYLWIEEGTLNADTGWVCTSDPGGVFGVTAITFVQFGGNGTVTAGAGITITGNQVSLGTPSTLTGATTNSAAGTTHTHALTLTKSDVGLSNVDNTSDVNKPVSTAQQTALDGKANLSGGNTFSSAQTFSGNVGIGAPASAFQFEVYGGTAGLGLSRTSGEAFVQLSDSITGTVGGQMRAVITGPGLKFTRRDAGVTWWTMPGLIPGADNTYDVGSASLRGRVAYFATGTINTSDAREKTDVAPLAAAELDAAADLARAIGTYQWLASIAKKDANNARHHAGLTVQRAIEIMQSHGLDPMRYGFICYDQWDETPEVVSTWPAQDAVLDESGNVVSPAIEAGSEITQAYRAAGDRYSFRTDELLLFLSRGFAARLDALEAA